MDEKLKICARLCADDKKISNEFNLQMKQSIHLPELMQDYALYFIETRIKNRKLDFTQFELLLDEILLEKYGDQADILLNIMEENKNENN